MSPVKPREKVDDIFGILPKARHEQYDMKEIIKRLVDDSTSEYKKDYGKTITLLMRELMVGQWALLPISVKWSKMRRVRKCSLEVSSTPILQTKQLDL